MKEVIVEFIVSKMCFGEMVYEGHKAWMPYDKALSAKHRGEVKIVDEDDGFENKGTELIDSVGINKNNLKPQKKKEVKNARGSSKSRKFSIKKSNT